jgi:hypothetical protein
MTDANDQSGFANKEIEAGQAHLQRLDGGILVLGLLDLAGVYHCSALPLRYVRIRQAFEQYFLSDRP